MNAEKPSNVCQLPGVKLLESRPNRACQVFDEPWEHARYRLYNEKGRLLNAYVTEKEAREAADAYVRGPLLLAKVFLGSDPGSPLSLPGVP